MADFLETQRQQLLASLTQAGIHDTRVLATIATTPRELFVEEAHYEHAYGNYALPIEMGQTISQPLMVAAMTQALELTGNERVLEIGTGSGYQTAILSKLAAHVYSIERHQALAWRAIKHLTEAKVENASVYVGDGTLGWPDEAPYDRILVTAAAPDIPPQLVVQLVPRGLLVIPVGKRERQELYVVQREGKGIYTRALGPCVFVPLIGEQGWRE